MITESDYKAAVARANNECQQEIKAASLEYRESVRPLASRRKARGKAAKKKRDERIRELKKQLAETKQEKAAK